MLSSGTITFLFTDIEGSTPAWEQHPGDMRSALEQHNTILQQVAANYNGQVFKIVGDEFQVAFTDPAQAVEAAIDIQHQLANTQWPSATGPLRVRMGIHTGEAQPDGVGDYVSTHTLNRVARICSAGHGGQILISLVSAELARESLGDRAQFQDMGAHHLKGMSQPEHLFQVVAPGLPVDFPPLVTLTGPNHNLPMSRTAFIGREKEIVQVQFLVETSRLVTLTGFGGVGKTRLSLQVAHALLEDFAEGVWWVELAPISDPDRIVDAIAEVLSVPEQPDRQLIETLENTLCQDKRLLVLDNCEHLIEACASLADRLLRNCSELHILASSREPLHVEGEVTLRVPTLSLPKFDCADVEDLLDSEAARLFLERARTALPEFELTETNCQAVQQVCEQLDGIPLAIELAAARVPVMQVSQIAARLDQVFRVLTSGSRTAMPRQQTLQATIDWSYQLLSQEERGLFERLSIFGGGWTLEAAEAVCSDQDIDEYLVLELLTNLTDKSLVMLDRRPDREGRYRFLETIHQYTRQKLEGAGQVNNFSRRHLSYYLDNAEKNAKGLVGDDQIGALNRMEGEADNFRTALSWSLAAPDTSEESVRLVVALGEFWLLRGNLHEGRQWLSAVLSQEETCAYPAERAKALHLAAMMAYRQSDYAASKAAWEESLQISREIGESGRRGVHLALTGLGNVATEVGDYETAPQLFTEALEITRQLGDVSSQADVLRNLGWAAMRPGDYQLASDYLEEALVLFRGLNHKVGLASTLSGLGEMALRQGDLNRAQSLVEESLELRRELDDKWGIGASLGTLGWAALSGEDYERAQQILGESLSVRQELGDKGGIAWCLEKLALTAQYLGQQQRAARLYGAASAIRSSIDSVIDPADLSAYEQNIAALKGALGAQDYSAFWAEGQAMTLDEAVAAALE
jgi:predicted ATPase/class 3 adenylate cyclase/Tfp pilus assembly protein PilF